MSVPEGEFIAVPVEHLSARPTYPPTRLSLLPQGHRTIAFTPKAEQGNGSYGHGVVLAAAPAGEYHTYVVWTAIDRPDGLHVEQGDYCGDLAHAVHAYTVRGGNMNGSLWNALTLAALLLAALAALLTLCLAIDSVAIWNRERRSRARRYREQHPAWFVPRQHDPDSRW